VRLVPLTFSICLCASTALASEIREFGLSTLEKLGNELSHRDEMAAKASDLVWAKDPAFKKVSPQGWVTDLHGDRDNVYFIVETKAGLAGAYKVTFQRGGSPRVEDIHGQTIPAEIATRYKARRTAIDAVRSQLNNAYDPSYNFEVLKDPAGDGFLVYALAAFAVKRPVYTGGHVRITVSGDGAKVKRIDQLSHGIVEQKEDKQHTIVAVANTQAVEAKYPVETWIYTSHLYELPLYIVTTDGTFWGVANGRIVRVDKKGPKNHLDILNGKAPNRHDPDGRY
jgi:hypothetical protein